MEKLLIDSDVTIDFLSAREGFRESADKLFSLIDSNKVLGFSTPIMISNIHYVLSSFVGKSKSIGLLKELRSKIQILTLNQKYIDSALTSDLPDFEDAIQYFTALDQSIDVIITSNKKDYPNSLIPVMTPSEYINYFLSIRQN